MRIIAVQTGLTPQSTLGGTITDREFLTRLADCGVEVHVLAEAHSPIIKHPNLVPHFWWRRIPKRLPYLGNLDVLLDLRRLVREIGPVDWIRFNNPYSVGIGTIAARTGIPIWGSYLHCENDSFWRLVDSWLPQQCDLITCLSADTRADVVARCPAADTARTIITPICIDTGRFVRPTPTREILRAQLGVAADEVVVLFVGVLIQRKGIADLVAAWELLDHALPTRLLIIGKSDDPVETARVSALAARDQRVRHLPQIPYEQIAAYFCASDIFFFPTQLEGFGIVVGEAMAAGLPVVTTTAKGVREVVVGGETALQAEVGDTRQMAAHLGRLIGDPALRQALGAAGQERIATLFNWDHTIEQLLRTLRAGARPVAAQQHA